MAVVFSHTITTPIDWNKYKDSLNKRINFKIIDPSIDYQIDYCEYSDNRICIITRRKNRFKLFKKLAKLENKRIEVEVESDIDDITFLKFVYNEKGIMVEYELNNNGV